MIKLVCKTHGVTLIIDGNLRQIIPLPGTFGIPCHLLSEFHPKKGKLGKCQIEKVD